MGFGPLMQFAAGNHLIRLRPFGLDETARFLVGMQSQNVIEMLALYHAQTPESEAAWLAKVAEDRESFVWAITVVSDEHPEGLAIGTTSIQNDSPRRIGHSGSVIFDRQYWRQGIATRCHMARTRFGFDQLGLLALESSFLHGNRKSERALWHSGYERTGGFSLHRKCIEGRWQPAIELLCVNPDETVWPYAWGGMKPPKRFDPARERALSATAWARANVEFL